MPEWSDSLKERVEEQPGMTGKQYASYLRHNGFPFIDKTEVNQELYGHKDIFDPNKDQWGTPHWRLKNLIQTNSVNQENVEVQWTNQLGLRPWQREALDAWKRQDYQGVVEAVTGAGKTHVALAAMEAHLRQGWRVVVVVPNVQLQKQWNNKVREIIIEKLQTRYGVSLLGGESTHCNNWDIMIAVANSASTNLLLENGYKGLIIADECHRYGSPQWSEILEQQFERRLGLTATFERSDNGVEEYLIPYFRGVCCSVNYRRALAEQVIAPFKIAFIGVSFSEPEKAEYEESDIRCRNLRQRLINTYGVPSEPFGEFMREVQHLRAGGEGEATRFARQYLSAFSKRRKVIAGATQKTACLWGLQSSIHRADRTIIFSQTMEAADRAVLTLNGVGINAQVMNSDMNLEERRQVFDDFESGEYELVAAPLLLDEGVDVPAADLAIVLAASRSKRQMIQRMGRVLRLKEDNRLARIAIIYVKDTSEDPELGAHDEFVEMIRKVAIEEEIFDSRYDLEEACRFLNEFRH